MGAETCLYRGVVMHRRLRPMRHRFAYRVFSVLLDLDEMPTLGLRLFAHNRPALFSFHDRDHGPRDGSPLRPWIERHLAAAGIELGGGRIFVHCLPRLLGYVFNPLSVFWCYDQAGRLRAVLYEVKNTFGEQHGYLLPVDPDRDSAAPIHQRTAKKFYVSPFIPMDVDYRFRVLEPGETLSLGIRESDAAGDILVATQTGRRRRLTDAALLGAFFSYPLVTLKVILAIHWEALRLWVKGARLVKRPAPPEGEVTS